MAYAEYVVPEETAQALEKLGRSVTYQTQLDTQFASSLRSNLGKVSLGILDLAQAKPILYINPLFISFRETMGLRVMDRNVQGFNKYFRSCRIQIPARPDVLVVSSERYESMVLYSDYTMQANVDYVNILNAFQVDPRYIPILYLKKSDAPDEVQKMIGAALDGKVYGTNLVAKVNDGINEFKGILFSLDELKRKQRSNEIDSLHFAHEIAHVLIDSRHVAEAGNILSATPGPQITPAQCEIARQWVLNHQ